MSVPILVLDRQQMSLLPYQPLKLARVGGGGGGGGLVSNPFASFSSSSVLKENSNLVLGLFLSSRGSRSSRICLLLDDNAPEVSELPELPLVTQQSRKNTVANCVDFSIAIARLTDELLQRNVIGDYVTEIERQITLLDISVHLMMPTAREDRLFTGENSEFVKIRIRSEIILKLKQLKIQMQMEGQDHSNTLLQLQTFISATVGTNLNMVQLEAFFNDMPDNHLFAECFRITEMFQFCVDILNWLTFNNFYLRSEIKEVFAYLLSNFKVIREEVEQQFREIDQTISTAITQEIIKQTTNSEYISRIKKLIDQYCDIPQLKIQNQMQDATVVTLAKLFKQMILCMNRQINRCVYFKTRDNTSRGCMLVDNIRQVCVNIIFLREKLREIQKEYEQQKQKQKEEKQKLGTNVVFFKDHQLPLRILGRVEKEVFSELPEFKQFISRRIDNPFWRGDILQSSLLLFDESSNRQGFGLLELVRSAQSAAGNRKNRLLRLGSGASSQPGASAAAPASLVPSLGSASTLPESEVVGSEADFDQQIMDMNIALQQSSSSRLVVDSDDIEFSLVPEMGRLAGSAAPAHAQGGPVEDPRSSLSGILKTIQIWGQEKLMEPLNNLFKLYPFKRQGGSIKKRNNRLDKHKITRSNKQNNDNTSSSLPKTKKIVKLQNKRKFTIKIKPKDALSEPKA
jgi:hypothetical protein